MKKTLIAASVAALVAAPAAFADVAISGNVIQEFITDGDDTGSSEDGLDSISAVDLVFSVSEDLGNGMSAFAKIHNYRDNAAPSAGGYADQIVGLKGDFGTVVVGRMEDFTEGKVSAMAATDSSDALSIETNRAYKTGRAEGGLAYVSPSFNGLTFGVAGYALSNGGASDTTTTVTVTGLSTNASAAGGSTQASITSTSAVLDYNNANNLDMDNNFDATDIMVEYSNGPLLVRVAHENVDAKATKAGASGKDQKTTTIGMNYKMDNITLAGVYYDVENGQGTDSNDVDGYFVGAKIAAGANTFGLGYTQETNINKSGSTYTKQTNGDNDSYIVSINHALSKRTSLTAAYKSLDDQDAGKDADNFAVGIKHVF